FREWKINIKNIAREGKNTLRVQFHSPTAMGLLHKDKWNIEAPIGYNFDFGPGIKIMGGPTSDCPPIGPYTRKAAYMYGWDWSPTLTTSGIWRPVYINAWDEATINNMEVVQDEVNNKTADLTVMTAIRSASSLDAVLTVSYKTGSKSPQTASVPVKLEEGLNNIPVKITINHPELWWPNGMGEHPVYEFTASLTENDKTIDEIKTRTGLRTVRLVRDKDKEGKSFYFEINGIPVFAKGADYVPTDIFPSRTTPEHYKRLLESAADAHINMLRVWGGGIYESDLFYDLCDELGIMIWQDFAFAIYQMPGDKEFLNSISHEVSENIKRLRNHPSIVLWCGNNETELIWKMVMKRFFGLKTPDFDMPLFNALKSIPITPVREETTEKVIKAYDDVFYGIIPDSINRLDHNKRPYWPSSPSSGGKDEPYNQLSGDAHYYVAYMNAPFEAYYTERSRFFSEHGFQSYPDFNTVKKFTESADWDYLSPIMQYHQRASNGNQVIDKYMKMYYHYPKDFETYLYVSQVMQADVMKIAFETHRRSRPFTMGTLYWQLNDVWPVASWSGIDYLNHWKALHYQVKRSFSKVILAPQYYRDTLHIYLVSDSLKNISARAEIRIMDFNGRVLKKLTFPARLGANTAGLIYMKEGKKLLPGIDTTNIMGNVKLVKGGKTLASNNFFFTAYKNLNLPKAIINKQITPIANGFKIQLTSDTFARAVFLRTEHDGFYSDNYFDLLPGETRIITCTTKQDQADFEKELKIISLADSY
ncbi:MAG TPA: glycoside hydrolase family 2 protein, partial [Bacteroidales bacterium]|nr:glycoside hydrolase family 2 protein [Bacteroidales bacterium]